MTLFDTSDPNFSHLIRVRKEKGEGHGRMAGFRTDGSRFIMEAAFRVFRSALGGLREARVFFDVARADEDERARGEFVATVSHELRTPLASIRGSLGLLEGGVVGALDPETLELVRIARSNCERLIRLINDMLDLEKLAAGSSDLSLSLLDPAQLVAGALAELPAGAAARVAAASWPDPPLSPLFGDRVRLVQAIGLLVQHALTFAPAESQVGLRLSEGLGLLHIEVSDGGAAIGTAARPIIWQPGEPHDIARLQPLHLELALVRSIVEQHGGNVAAQRDALVNLHRIELPVGALRSRDSGPVALIAAADPRARALIADVLELEGFSPVALTPGARPSLVVQGLRLLVADPAPAVDLTRIFPGRPALILTPPIAREAVRSEVRRLLRAVPRRLLILDEDEDTRMLLAAALRDLGVTFAAARPERAIRLGYSLLPDLVVLDASMGGVPPFEVVERLRQGGLADAALIVHTEFDPTPGDRERLRLGPTAYLTKTETPLEQLVDLARQLLEQLPVRT